MISSIVSRLVILVFGTLYPAYASYKAVRTKNVKEYVKWMMYWIVFALFTCAETFMDVFLSFWFPFYYEIKVILVLWLLSPATKGSSILYRKFVHPTLSRHEQEIDEYISKAKEQGYHTVLHLATKGVNYATTVLMQTAIKGGGGLVNQLRRSYSLSDLSSDKESDMNRNSKALKNIPDEDDMEETDGLDPRMLRPRGYSPRRSASGSGRMEMYFPEVDVDVRQHNGSRPREPGIPLSHIRSSEDVSSGYSSAEPLYAGHHATKSEGLAASREPLVRTASVGSTRPMRTKSSRGGAIAKKAPAAEDSELLDLQGDEADHHYQEEYFYDVSSSLSSRASTSIQFPMSVIVNRSAPPLSFVSEISYPSAHSDINNMTSAQEHYINASDVKSDSPDDEDMPLYDTESDKSKIPGNEFLLPEPVVPLVKDNLIYTSNHETPLSKDVIMPHLDTAANGTVCETVVSSTDVVLSTESLTSDLNTTNNNTVLDTFTAQVDAISIDETFTKNKNEMSIQKESSLINVKDLPCEQTISQHMETEPRNLIDKVDIPSDSVETKTQNLDLVSDLVKHAESSSLVQPTHTTLVPEASDTSLDSDAVVSKSAGKDEPSSSEIKEVNIVTDETVSQTLAAVPMSPLTLTTAELLSTDNTLNISLESQDSKYDSGVEQSDYFVDKSALNSGHVDTEKPITETLKTIEVEHDTPKLDAGPPSRSSSQGSLRKDGRAGRYHKRPAPTPPPKNPESESEDWADVREPQSSCDADDIPLALPEELVEDMPSPKALRCEDSESPVTARLVLKPGVVRPLGPDSGTKAEVFVSRTPQTKGKKTKSKGKQGDSTLSRLFVLPKDQFGGLSSLFPFWHGKPDASASASADTPNGTPKSSDMYSSSALLSRSGSAFVAVHEKASSGSERDKPHSSSDVNVTEMSSSPGQRRRAPLADWE